MVSEKENKIVLLPVGKVIKCHSAFLVYEVSMKRKTLIFYFNAKRVHKEKKITFCANWTNISKLVRITFANHPAEVFAFSH